MDDIVNVVWTKEIFSEKGTTRVEEGNYFILMFIKNASDDFVLSLKYSNQIYPIQLKHSIFLTTFFGTESSFFDAIAVFKVPSKDNLYVSTSKTEIFKPIEKVTRADMV